MIKVKQSHVRIKGTGLTLMVEAAMAVRTVASELYRKEEDHRILEAFRKSILITFDQIEAGDGQDKWR